MDDFMVWLYFHYIMPTLEEASKGDFAEPINRLRSQLDVYQEWDLDHIIEYYASGAFQLGLRTGAALQALSCEDACPNQRL